MLHDRAADGHVFPTADGFVQITALRQPQVEVLFAELGIAARLQTPKFATPTARARHPEEVHQLLVDALSAGTTAEWLERLTRAGVPVASVRTLPEVVQDPQFAHRRVFAELPVPGRTEAETHQVVTSGFITDRDGPQVRQPAPLLGDSTNQVLSELGYGPEEIARLRERKIV